MKIQSFQGVNSTTTITTNSKKYYYCTYFREIVVNVVLFHIITVEIIKSITQQLLIIFPSDKRFNKH